MLKNSGQHWMPVARADDHAVYPPGVGGWVLQ